MIARSTRLLNLVLILMLVALSPELRAQAATHFTLPSQPLADALRAVGTQTNTSVVFDPTLVEGRRAPALDAQVSLDEALSRLLAKSGLSHQFLNERTVVLAPSQVAQPPVKTSARANGSGETAQVPAPERRKKGQAMKLAQTAEDSEPGTSAQSDDAVGRGKIQEIVVTAQKRAERLIDVPMSITAMSGEDLTAAGINNMQDLSFAVPGLMVAEMGPARQYIAIRGVFNHRGTAPLVGTYLDEIPVLSGGDGLVPVASDLRTLDLERVEVLKGPQGTLFGEGAAGGVIRFITKDPDLSGIGGGFSGKLHNTKDGEWSQEVNGIFNLPLVQDVFGIRMAAAYESKSGWIDQPSVGRENINDSEVKHVRAKALFTPNPELRIEGMAIVHRNDGGAVNIVTQEPYDESLFRMTIDPTAPTGYTDSYDMYNLTITYDLGFAEILSSTSRTKGDNRQSFTYMTHEVPKPWFEVYIENYSQDFRTTDQEFRLTSVPGGRMKWTLGAAYKKIDTNRSYGPVGFDADIFGGAASLRGILEGTTYEYEDWIAFADAGYELTEKFEVGAGLRYIRGDRGSRAFSLTGGAGDLSSSYDKVTYRALVKYKPTTDLNVYASVGTGFRAGYPNAPTIIARGAPAAVGPEDIIFYELGAKMAALDGRLSMNAAVFFGEYSGMQGLVTIISPVDGVPIALTSNSQDSEIKGIEADVVWAATDRLTLSLGGDRIESEITKLKPSLVPLPFRVGDPNNLIPEYSLSLATDYRFPWSGSVEGFFLMRLNQQGKSFYTDRGSGLLPTNRLIAMSGEKTFLNASIGAEWNGWDVSLFGNNLLDEREPVNPSAVWTIQARPATVGIGFGKSF